MQTREVTTGTLSQIRSLTSSVAKSRKWEKILPYLLLSPAVILILVFIGSPLVYGITLAFTDKSLISTTTSFVGLRNVQKMIRDPVFWQSLRQSFLWTFYTVSGEIVIGLALALLLTQHFRGRGFFRAILLAPWTSPLVAVATVFLWLYDPMIGYLKYFLTRIGLPNIMFLANPRLSLASVSVPVIWRSFPFVMLMFIAGLEAIDKELYEAASIDGAGVWTRFRFVTLPLLRPVLLVVTLLEIIWMFNEFAVIWVMTRGGPVNSTHILATYTYWESIMMFRVGYGSAVALVMLLILLIFSLLYWRLRREQ